MLSKLRGTIHNNLLDEFMVGNTYIYSPQHLLHRVTDNFMGYASVNMPLFDSVSVSGYYMQEAGSNAALELAFTISERLE